MTSVQLSEKFETERLLIQRLRYEDADEIFYTYASKPEATRYVSWPRHIRVEDTRSFLRYAVSGWDKGIDHSFSVRLKKSNQLIGSIGALNEEGKVQFGYVFSPTQWGKGYATETCAALLTQLKKHPGVYRIWTLVDTENVASVRVLTKCGLVQEAVLRHWMRFINQGNAPKDCILFKLPLE